MFLSLFIYSNTEKLRTKYLYGRTNTADQTKLSIMPLQRLQRLFIYNILVSAMLEISIAHWLISFKDLSRCR